MMALTESGGGITAGRTKSRDAFKCAADAVKVTNALNMHSVARYSPYRWSFRPPNARPSAPCWSSTAGRDDWVLPEGRWCRAERLMRGRGSARIHLPLRQWRRTINEPQERASPPLPPPPPHCNPPPLQPQCLYFHKFNNLIRLKDRVRNDSRFLMWFGEEGGKKRWISIIQKGKKGRRLLNVKYQFRQGGTRRKRDEEGYKQMQNKRKKKSMEDIQSSLVWNRHTLNMPFQLLLYVSQCARSCVPV